MSSRIDRESLGRLYPSPFGRVHLSIEMQNAADGKRQLKVQRLDWYSDATVPFVVVSPFVKSLHCSLYFHLPKFSKTIQQNQGAANRLTGLGYDTVDSGMADKLWLLNYIESNHLSIGLDKRGKVSSSVKW